MMMVYYFEVYYGISDLIDNIGQLFDRFMGWEGMG